MMFKDEQTVIGTGAFYLTWSAAAISRVAASVMIVIRSSGLNRRQVRIALRAPGTSSGSTELEQIRSGIREG